MRLLNLFHDHQICRAVSGSFALQSIDSETFSFFHIVGWLKKPPDPSFYRSGKRIRDAAFFLIIMLVTFAATLLNPQKYVSSRTIQKCVEHVSTSTEP